MFKYVALSVLACAATSTMVNAWGENGHSAVGILMQRLLNPTTLKNIQRLLDEDTDVKGDFGRAATWADRIKSKGELYRWASPLHYVDIAGPTPNSCGVYKEEDCPNGVCIISGIANYTSRVACDKNGSERMEAIKFLIHFLGDIGQPLHATGEARGGNDFHCLWQGKKSNLHSVWDGKILDTTINGQFNAYIDSIEKDIRTGKYANEKANWLNCFNNANNVDLKACTIAWANESNKFNCDYLIPTYKAAESAGTLEMSGKYYQENAERVNMFIARAAVRGAQYLDSVLASCNAQSSKPFVATPPNNDLSLISAAKAA